MKAKKVCTKKSMSNGETEIEKMHIMPHTMRQILIIKKFYKNVRDKLTIIP